MVAKKTRPYCKAKWLCVTICCGWEVTMWFCPIRSWNRSIRWPRWGIFTPLCKSNRANRSRIWFTVVHMQCSLVVPPLEFVFHVQMRYSNFRNALISNGRKASHRENFVHKVQALANFVQLCAYTQPKIVYKPPPNIDNISSGAEVTEPSVEWFHCRLV